MPTSFHGLNVVTFESRRASEMCALIERHEGRALSAPTIREVPKDTQTESLEFAVRLLDGNIDAAIFLTGVGTRIMFEAIGRDHSIDEIKAALSAITTIARGPKPVAVLREYKFKPTIVVPEPNTWQDLLDSLDSFYASDSSDAGDSLDGKTIAVQEYGMTNARLVEALKQRGAEVFRVPVYEWALPEDTGPLQTALDGLLDGTLDVAMFTSATQVYHLFEFAEAQGKKDDLREAFKRVYIASVGPVCTEAIEDHGLKVDYEPDAPHMLPLVRESARRSRDLLAKKRVACANGIDTNCWRRTEMIWSTSPGADTAAGMPTIADSVFMKACRREPTPYTPVWIMRQAGRYQREYRAIRKGITLLDLCHTPETAAEVTLMAVDRLGADAAIIFSDILPIVEPLGFNLEYVKGDGPVIHNPYRDRDDIKRLQPGTADDLAYVYEALQITRKALRPDIALIGFCGAPFTIASYLIEGGKSKNYWRTKSMMYRDDVCWNTLMERLVDMLIDYLNKQVEAGADAVQVFDSWAGSLSPDDYRQYVMPHVQRLIAGVKAPSPNAPKPPVINFATGNPALLPLMKEAGGDVIGLDWRIDLADAWEMLGHDDVAVMGNLDPVVLYGSIANIREHAKRILDKAAGRPGHIFNLGHGISPDMSPEHVAELVDAVQQMSKR